MLRIAFIFTFIGLILMLPLMAEEKSHSWEAGLGAYMVGYRDAGGNSEGGFLCGAQASYRAQRNSSFWKAAAYYYGGMPYSHLNDRLGDKITAINDDALQEVRFLLGRQLSAKPGSCSYLSAGLGLRNWFKSPKAGGVFVNNYNYLYTPIVWEHFRGEENRPRKLTVEGDWLWNTQVQSKPAWFPEGYNSPVNHISGGFGLRVSYDLIKRWGPKKAFIIQPNVEYWNLPVSNTTDLTQNGVKKADFSIPSSQTWFYGLNLNWEW